MKHILPVLTVSALAAAASAQVAPAPTAKQALSYNRVIASWVSVGGADNIHGASIAAQAKIGSGLYVSASSVDLQGGIADSNHVALGYAYSLGSALGVNTDLNVEVGYKSLGAGLRFLVGGGLEVGVAYAHGAGAVGNNPNELSNCDTLTYTASYNLGFLVKGLSVNASYASQTGTADALPGFGGVGVDVTSVGIGYNF